MSRFSLLLIASTLSAQTLTLTGPAVVLPGSAVTLTVGLVSGGGPAGIQFDMGGLPAGTSVTSIPAAKMASCTPTRCLLTGMNQTAIPDGPIATIKYTQPSTPVKVTLSASAAVTPAGSGVTVMAPATLTIGTLSTTRSQTVIHTGIK